MMPVQKGDFIRLTYTGDIEGSVFDTTDEEKARAAGIYNAQALYGPVIIHVGSRHVILGLDDALVGEEIGTSHEVIVPPEQAFGPHDPEKIHSIPKSKFKDRPTIGMPVKSDEHGEGTVVNVIGNRVIADFNHPLAGKTLHYAYTIEEIVSEPREQMSGLIRLYAGRDLDLSIDAGIATITLPPGITYDRRWLLWRSRIVFESIEFIPSISEIVLTERFSRSEIEAAREKNSS